MTMQELITMMGDEDSANWVKDRLLEAVKPEFVVTILQTLADETEKWFHDREESGYYSELLPFPEDFCYWSASEEMQDKFDQAEARLFEKAGDRAVMTMTKNMWVRALNNMYKVTDRKETDQ